MGKKVIIMNGPPFSGKDTSADMVELEYGADHLRFKTKLYAITALINNLDLTEFIDVATNVDLKDTLVLKNGKTARQLLIQTSEDVIKPTYGDDYFGKDVGDSILKSDNTLFVISDSGFTEELKSMMLGGNLDGSAVTLVRIHRDGCNFDNDSRKYITDEFAQSLGIKVYDVYNNDTKEYLQSLIATIVVSL